MAEPAIPSWGSTFRLTASERWKAKSAALGANVTSALVEYAAPKKGMQVLDLGSGTGEPGITIAGIVNPTGHVTALDQSTELLEIAEARAQQRGLANFTTCLTSAETLPFPENRFDLIASRFAVMFFASDALREARRVLKPGARACFAAWGPFEQPYWSSMMGIVHKHVGGPLLPASHDPFRFSRPGSLSSALEQAGFSRVEEQTVDIPWNWPGTKEDLWEYAQSVAAPFRPMLERVPVEKWNAIHQEVHNALQAHVERDTVKFNVAVVLASGTKP